MIKFRRIRSIGVASAAALVCLVSTGCDSGSSSSRPQSSEANSSSEITEATVPVDFQYSVNSLFSQTIASSYQTPSQSRHLAREFEVSFDSDDVVTGELLVDRLDDDAVADETLFWSVFIDKDTLEAQSNGTLALVPGAYRFDLLVESDGQQYVGSSTQTVDNEGEHDVAMTIKPVFGETIVNVLDLGASSDLTIRYSAEELSSAGLTDPLLGVVINGGDEVVYRLDTTTGVAQDQVTGLDVTLNLDTGDHTIHLNLYDGVQVVGVSDPAQEDITVNPGSDIRINMIPLHGEAVFTLTEEGENADFRFNIPSIIIDEAGGLARLRTDFAVEGTAGVNALFESALTVTEEPPASGQYSATQTVPNFHHDDSVMVTLTFYDTDPDPDELLGSCVTNSFSTQSVDITLGCEFIRRDIVTGNILSVVGFNIFNNNSEPVAGASVIEVDDAGVETLLGLTNSGSFGTSGYFKTFLSQGDHNIRVDSFPHFAERTISLSLLVHNVQFTLDQNVTTGRHSCSFTGSGDVKCWGANLSGQAGQGNTDPIGDDPGELEVLTAIAMPIGLQALEISQGARHTCGILTDDSVRCWGENEQGQLGVGSTDNVGDASDEMGDFLQGVELPAGYVPVRLSAGYEHSCAVLFETLSSVNRVLCWGGNKFGQLGDGSNENLGDDVDEVVNATPIGFVSTSVSQVVTGEGHTCALLSDSTVYCWGLNDSGQLGQGDTIDRSLPALVSVGGGSNIAELSAGAHHTCARLVDGNVRCWGLNDSGQLGQGDTENVGDNEIPDSLNNIDFGAGVTATRLAAGGFHACAVLSSAASPTVCWGNNEFGQLGQGNTSNIGDEAGEIAALSGVDLGTGLNALVLVGRHYGNCAVVSSGNYKCWGNNDFGALGLGDTNHRGDDADEMGDLLPTISL